MTSFRIRPRFQITTPHNPDEVIRRLKEQLSKPHVICIGTYTVGHATLRFPMEKQHFWSPVLDLTIEDADSGSLLRGLYGPEPQVWYTFALAYLSLGTLSLFAGLYGLSRLSLGMSAQILWLLPVFLGIALALYIASQVGQKLAAEQTFYLHHQLEDALQETIHIL